MVENRRKFLIAMGGATAALTAPSAVLARRKVASDADVSKLYDAAKREGTLTWWTAHYAQDAAERIRDAFKTKYPGVDVQLLRQTAQVLYQRLTQDMKSNVHQLDVFASTDEAHLTALKKVNALAEFVPADIDKLAPAFREIDSNNTYQAGALGLVLFDYNPKKLQPPKKWADLADARFKGQITLGHPAFSGYVGNWVVAMNDKYGWDYFKKLEANQPKINRSIFDTVTDIVGGERAIGAGPDSLSLEKKAGGSSIDIAYPDDGAVLIVAPVAVLREAPHPNAARLFMNFMASREYSQALVKSYNLPLRPDVAPAGGKNLDHIKHSRVKVDRLTTGIPEVVAKWRETFGV